MGGALIFTYASSKPASVAAGPVDSAPKQPVDKPSGVKQLETSLDPLYMEKTTMTTLVTDGKMLINALNHGTVVAGIAAEYTRFWKMAMEVPLTPSPKLDFTPSDVGMS